MRTVQRMTAVFLLEIMLLVGIHTAVGVAPVWGAITTPETTLASNKTVVITQTMVLTPATGFVSTSAFVTASVDFEQTFTDFVIACHHFRFATDNLLDPGELLLMNVDLDRMNLSEGVRNGNATPIREQTLCLHEQNNFLFLDGVNKIRIFMGEGDTILEEVWVSLEFNLTYKLYLPLVDH